ncbi:phytosulfokines-like [Trifolium pratense]|uniref:Uncharacterized protein n=1 Tax=Trifolium pratense TaxID=57577 RepID=A0ACB0M0J6_TRIPR|nr:phytosulfokines-like [Trifolium pratense]CAJ2675321.1 unnamed protein product [Trifolium pratense]
MSKIATIIVLALLLSFGLIYASRPNIGLNSVSSIDKDVSSSNAFSEDESCEGVGGEQECLSRRTLEAHLDYIYTNSTQT